MPDWNAPDVQTWKEDASEFQQNMFLRLGDREWDTWNKSNTRILHRKVGFAMFSPPENLPKKSNNFTGYSKKQFKEIKLVADVILGKAASGSAIHFACIFVFGKIGNRRFITPIFKVKGNKNETFFVDFECQVYDSWRFYLDSNHLPKCMYCYPLDGSYKHEEGKVLVDFGTSPACHRIKRKYSIRDKTAVNVASNFAIGASTLASPRGNQVVAEAGFEDTEAQHTFPGSTNLEDYYFHNLRTAGSVLRRAHGQLLASITRAAAAGDIVSEASRTTYNVVSIGSLTVNGIQALKDFVLVVDKAIKGTLTDLDVLQFTTSALFFSDSLFLEGSAERIIEKTQKQVLNHHCDDLSEEQREEFFRLSKKVQGEEQIHKNANVIKAINQIDDKQAFYESLVTAKSDLQGHVVEFSFEELGLVNINNELHIGPNKLVQLSKEDRQKILEATQNVEGDALNSTVYQARIEAILKSNRLYMQFQRRVTIAHLKEAFRTDDLKLVEIGNEKIFKNMTPSELDRLTEVIKGLGRNYNPKILEIATEFSERRCCKTPRDYSNYVEFTAKYLSELKKQKDGKYKEALSLAREHGHIDENRFAREYGIQGKKEDHFKKQAYDDFITNREESFKALEKKYIDLESTVRPLNANMEPNFALDSAAVYHYFKHSDFGGEVLTADKYFEIASQLVNEPLNRSSEQLNQQGNIKRITFINPIRGAFGIVFETLADGAQTLATVHYDQRVLNRSI